RGKARRRRRRGSGRAGLGTWYRAPLRVQFSVQVRSERYLGLDAEAIHPAGDRAGGQVVAVVFAELELHLHVAAHVPVENDADALHVAAADHGGAGAVVKARVGPAAGDFPGAPAHVEPTVLVAGEPGVGEGSFEVIAGEAAEALVIGPVLAGEEIRK